MPDASRLLAIVPARGGSKRLPRKNVLPLAGKPLIAWTIAAAQESGAFDDVLVSTDDHDIAAAAGEAGALVPWLRPAELATDTATSASVLQHATAWYQHERGPVSGVALLQPTSPFRTADSIRGAVAQFRSQRAGDVRTVVSVSPALQHPNWCFHLDQDDMVPFQGWDGVMVRSQDLRPAYALNGAIYVIPAERLLNAEPLVGPGVRAFIMRDPQEALDIDTADDWRKAEEHARSLGASTT